MTPLPLVTHSRKLSVLFVTHWVTPSPLEHDVIYGWSLILLTYFHLSSESTSEWEAELQGELNEYEVVKDSVEEDNPEWENQESKIAQSIH